MLAHTEGGADGPQQELLRTLSAAGVPPAHLQLIEPLLTTLQPTQVVELCRCVPRLLLVQCRERSERGSAQSAQVLAIMAARREAHKARLAEYTNYFESAASISHTSPSATTSGIILGRWSDVPDIQNVNGDSR